MGVWYASREDVKTALDSKETARNNAQVDRAIEYASRSIEKLCHRVFHPTVATRYFDWPNHQYAKAWRLWLDQNDLISVTSFVSGGVTIPPADYFLEPVNSGPPFNYVEIDLGSSSSLSAGDTFQRSTAITGLWGYGNDEAPAGAVGANATSSATSIQVTDSAAVGVGQVLRIGTERLLVTEKAMKDTGVNIDASDSLTAAKNDVSITLSTLTAAPTVGEVILIDSERMLVVDVAGSAATVIRGWDGSVLAAHAANADIYAPRTLTVTRGALGTTAAAMTAADPVVKWTPPGPVRELCVAEAVVALLRETSGYAAQTGVGSQSRTVGGGQATRTAPGIGIGDLRDQVYASHGRKARSRAV